MPKLNDEKNLCCHCGSKPSKLTKVCVAVKPPVAHDSDRWLCYTVRVCASCVPIVLSRYPTACPLCERPKNDLTYRTIKVAFLSPPEQRWCCEECATKLHNPDA